MPANVLPIFPVEPVFGEAYLDSPSVVTSRARITGTVGLTELLPVQANGQRVDAIRVHGAGDTVASMLFFWIFDGTYSSLFYETPIDAVTPDDTTPAYSFDYKPANLVLPPTCSLWVSQTVATPVTVMVLGGKY